MARIRSIKPEFPQSETIGKLSRDARLLFVMLWTVVDDDGRARAASRMLASLLYPYDDDVPKLIGGWLDELELNDCIGRYEVGGSSYLFVCNWLKHQKIDHKAKSKLPPPPEALANPREPSRTLAPDLGPRTLERDEEQEDPEADASGADLAPAYADIRHELWSEGKPILRELGLSESQAGKQIGRWLKETADDCHAVLGAIQRARDHRPAGDVIAFITASLPTKASHDRSSRQAPKHALSSAFDRLSEHARRLEDAGNAPAGRSG